MALCLTTALKRGGNDVNPLHPSPVLKLVCLFVWPLLLTCCRCRGLYLHLVTMDATPLDEWSLQRVDRYLTTHNTHKRQTTMSPAAFEPAISASEQTQTHALDSEATGDRSDLRLRAVSLGPGLFTNCSVELPCSSAVWRRPVVRFLPAGCSTRHCNKKEEFLVPGCKVRIWSSFSPRMGTKSKAREA
jgi:hypothetical protein